MPSSTQLAAASNKVKYFDARSLKFSSLTPARSFLYGLDPHLDRLISSAGKAGIPLPYQRPQLKQILIDTVAASDSWQGQLRYWVTAGQGGFNLSSKE